MSTPEVLSKLQALLERVRARSRGQGPTRVAEVLVGDASRPGAEARRTGAEPSRSGPGAARSAAQVALPGSDGVRSSAEAARPTGEATRPGASSARGVPEAPRLAPDVSRAAPAASRSAPEVSRASPRSAPEAPPFAPEPTVPVARAPARPEPPRPAVERPEVPAPPAPVAERADASTWTPVPPAEEPEIVIDVEETEPLRATRHEEGAEAVESQARTSESDERLRAAQASTSEADVEVARSRSASGRPAGEAAGLSASSPEHEPEEPTRTVEALAEAEEERAPASSRRPVALAAEDHLAQMAFGTEESSVPHHTPPPESGRLPSASADEFDDTTGIRGARVEETGRKVISHLTAESTRANLQRSDVVVESVGEARPFAPATFLELLEASLDL